MASNYITLPKIIDESGNAIEFEIVPSDSKNIAVTGSYQNEIDEIDRMTSEMEEKAEELDSKIEQLTNHADRLDYTIAVASGVICGLIDSIFVGEFSFEKANEWGTEKTNNFVVKIANKHTNYSGNDLAQAVKALEDDYPIPADKATKFFGGGRQHHLRDFSHHMSPVGLFFSLLTQFTKRVYGTNTQGFFDTYKLKGDELLLIGKNPQECFTFGVINWIFHMVSDMAGSYGTIVEGKVGTGIPGPLGSLIKEASALPFFTKVDEQGRKEFSVYVSKLFNGTLLGEHDANGKIVEPLRFDLRTEIGSLEQLGKQAIPVLINECIVRSFYFIRRLINEIKKLHSIRDWKQINWKNTLPMKNRTVIRMLTISTGTFMAVDMADSAIRGAIASGGVVPAFFTQFVLRVNFIGVGRFAIAVKSDVKMGKERNIAERERIAVYDALLSLTNAKLYYRQVELLEETRQVVEKEQEMWTAARNAAEAINATYEAVDFSLKYHAAYWVEVVNPQQDIPSGSEIEIHNPGLRDELLKVLKY